MCSGATNGSSKNLLLSAHRFAGWRNNQLESPDFSGDFLIWSIITTSVPKSGGDKSTQMCYDNRKNLNKVICMNDFTQRGIFRWMGKLGAIVLLNLLWLLCCLPVVTVIPSCVAMYDCVVCCLHGDEDGVCRRFFATFKTVLLRGIGLTVLWLIIGALLFVGYQVLNMTAGENGLLQIYSMVYAGSMLLPVAVLAWLIPIEARFAQGFGELHKSAIRCAIIHLPTTGVLLGILFVGAVMMMIVPFVIALLPSIIVAFQSALTEKVFDRYVVLDM